jgi:hypothetical protein
MPPYSSLRTFIDALTTGQTNITRGLDTLANNESKKAAYGAQIAQPGHLSGNQLPDWLRRELSSTGVTAEEIAHMERWPADEREAARAALHEAWTAGHDVRFEWEIHEGGNPKTERRGNPPADAIEPASMAAQSSGTGRPLARIVFRSPRKGVRITSKVNLGEIKVEA